MKRLLCLLLAVMTLLSMVSCASSLATDETEEEVITTAEETKKTEEKKVPKWDSSMLPEGFCVGYSRKDMTPDKFPVLSYNGDYAKSAHDPLQMTCVAISDGENVALIVTMDLRNIGDTLSVQTREVIAKAADVPFENILLNSSHSHSAVDCNIDDASVSIWKTKYYKLLPEMAREAMHDLTPAQAYVGKSHTEGLTFVRRYYREDGTFTGIHINERSDAPIQRHETEADNEMRVIRFDREGDKKDVLVVNYQTHYGSASNLWPEQLSADFVHPFRESAEKELDCLFSYCNGASGNIAFNTRIQGERKYPTFPDAIPHMMDVVKSAIATEEKAETGKVQVVHNKFEEPYRKYDAELVNKAKIVAAAEDRSTKESELVAQYGFESRYHATSISGSASRPEMAYVPFTAISFGDIGIAAAPYEMFDTTGQEIRAASPFKMTFTLGYTNGSFSYVPSALAWKNGGYEVYTCQFGEGCGERFGAELVRLLTVCHDAT